MNVEEKSKVKRGTSIWVSNPCPERISGGGGSNSFLDIQGIEAYRGLINKDDTQKCAALLCSFKKKHFNHNKSELVSSLLQCKVERNKCGKADLTALSPDGKPPLKLGLPRKGGLVHPSRAREYAETQIKERASSAFSQRMRLKFMQQMLKVPSATWLRKRININKKKIINI